MKQFLVSFFKDKSPRVLDVDCLFIGANAGVGAVMLLRLLTTGDFAALPTVLLCAFMARLAHLNLPPKDE